MTQSISLRKLNLTLLFTTLALAFSQLSHAGISISPNGHNFGTVTIGSSASIGVSISSEVGMDGDVSSSSGPFMFTSSGCSGQTSCVGTVTVSPNSPGPQNGSALISEGEGTATATWTASVVGACPAGQVWDGESLCITQVGFQDIDGDGVLENDACPNNPGPASNQGCPISDVDVDGIPDNDDNCPSTPNPNQADSDLDGVGDACDDTLGTDIDNDGINDDIDNCPSTSNPDQTDIDGDGIGDACDSLIDSDSDGISDSDDNCPSINNPGQADLDEDGIGDACDDLIDSDNDGVADNIDNCPSISNTNQSDLDGDGVGDACDNLADSDNDGIGDDTDNCPSVSNPAQTDLDEDGIGDLCDDNVTIDSDLDGINDGVDNCPEISNPGQADSDGDRIGDACDPTNDNDLDNDGIDNDNDNCPLVANPGQADLDSDGQGNACDTADNRDSDSDGIADSADQCPLVAGTAEFLGCPAKQAVQDLLDQFTDSGNQSQNRVVGALASTCSSDRELPQQLKEDCSRLLLAAKNGNNNVRNALRRITPEAAVRSNRTVRQGGQTQIQNIGGRIAGLRTGNPGAGGGFSLSGFNLTVNDEVIPIGQIATSLKQQLEQQSDEPQATTAFNQSRLGVFITGDIAPGKRKQTEREPGFDFDTYGITAGVDYRFTDWFILGAALGYMNTEAELDGNLGELDTTGYSLSVYGSYFPGDNYYIDFAVTWGQNDFDQQRSLQYSLNDGFDIDQNMSADYDGDMVGFTIGTGYDFRMGAWDFGPRANLQYLKSDTDSFTESASRSGAGSGWAVQMDSYEQEWLTLELGGRLGYTMKASWGILIPYVQLDYLHEFDNDSMVITGRFVADLAGDGLSVVTDEPDRNYFRARIGASAQWANGVAGFVDYSTTLSDDLWDRDRINFGLRWEF